MYNHSYHPSSPSATGYGIPSTTSLSSTASTKPLLTRDQQWEARRAQFYRARSLGYKQGIQPVPQYDTYVPYKINYTNVKNNIIEDYNQALIQQGQSPRPLHGNSYSHSYPPEMVMQMQRIGGTNNANSTSNRNPNVMNSNSAMPSLPSSYPMHNPPSNSVPDALDYHMKQQQQQPSSSLPSSTVSLPSNSNTLNDPSLSFPPAVRSREDVLRAKQAVRLQNSSFGHNGGPFSNVGSSVIGNGISNNSTNTMYNTGSLRNEPPSQPHFPTPQMHQQQPSQQQQQQQYTQPFPYSSTNTHNSFANNVNNVSSWSSQPAHVYHPSTNARTSRQLLQPPGGSSSFSFG